MQTQSAQWLGVRRDRPAWIIMWGWGAMNPTAVKEASKINYPMDHLVSVWWGGSEDEAPPAGPAAKGYITLHFSAVGANFAPLRDVQQYVVDQAELQGA